MNVIKKLIKKGYEMYENGKSYSNIAYSFPAPLNFSKTWWRRKIKKVERGEIDIETVE